MPIKNAEFMKKTNGKGLYHEKFGNAFRAMHSGLKAIKNSPFTGYDLHNGRYVGEFHKKAEKLYDIDKNIFELQQPQGEEYWEENLKAYVENFNEMVKPENYVRFMVYANSVVNKPSDELTEKEKENKKAYTGFVNNFEKYANLLNTELDLGIDIKQLEESKKLYEQQAEFLKNRGAKQRELNESQKAFKDSQKKVADAGKTLYNRHRGDALGLFSGASTKMGELRTAYERYARYMDSPNANEFKESGATFESVVSDLKKAADAYIKDKKFDKNGKEKSDPSSNMGIDRLAAARSISEYADKLLENRQKQEQAKAALENEFKSENAPLEQALKAPKVKVEEAPKAEEAPKVEEAPKAEEAPKVEEAPKAEEAPKVEEAPKAPTFEEQLAAFQNAAAESLLRSYHGQQMDAYFQQYPNMTEEEKQKVNAENNVDEYVQKSKENFIAGEDFQNFMNSVTNAQQLGEMQDLLQDAPAFYAYFRKGTYLKQAEPEMEIVENLVKNDGAYKAPAPEEAVSKKFKEAFKGNSVSANIEIDLDEDYDDSLNEYVDLDLELKLAQNSLTAEMDKTKQYPNYTHEDVREDYAKIVSAHMIRAEQKNGKYTNMKTEEFYDYAKELSGTKPFSALMRKYKEQGMYDKATRDKGQDLYTSMKKAQLDYQEHLKQKEGLANNKNLEQNKDKNIAAGMAANSKNK